NVDDRGARTARASHSAGRGGAMSGPIAPFGERYRKALADVQLRKNLLSFQRAWRASRGAALGHPEQRAGPGFGESRFEGRIGRAVSREDVSEMAGAAREELRKVFAEADVGMTGANALIAESGTVMLVTNEGNGRLTSSLPPVHVVLAGWEKLVPTFED